MMRGQSGGGGGWTGECTVAWHTDGERMAGREPTVGGRANGRLNCVCRRPYRDPPSRRSPAHTAALAHALHGREEVIPGAKKNRARRKKLYAARQAWTGHYSAGTQQKIVLP